MGIELRREVAVLSRELEFFTEKELTARMGGGPELWPLILVKELIDNALDAAEGAGPPCVEVSVGGDGFAVSDNGPGLPEEIIRGSLDYNVRVSDKSLYVTPTRGQLGNALKCVWAAPFVAHGHKAAVVVEAGDRKHTVRVSADEIENAPVIGHDVEAVPVRTGTRVTVGWPEQASYGGAAEGLAFYRLVQGFAALNPHARFRYTAKGAAPREIEPTQTSWPKWLSTQRPPPHWYDLGRFRSLVAGKLAACRRAGARPQTVRDFIGENFCGLTGTVVRGELLRGCGLDGTTLDRLAPGEKLDDVLLGRLLAAMKEHARPMKPAKVGLIGKAHMHAAAVNLFGAAPDTVRYHSAVLEVGGVPYALEVAFGFYWDEQPDEVAQCVRVTGVNWSPSLHGPFRALEWMLGDSEVAEEDPCVLIAHLTCPRPEFTDTGKTVLALPDDVQDALEDCVRKATALWKKITRKANREDARKDRLREQEIKEALRQQKAGLLSIKAACCRFMHQAYMEASGNGSRPANARQIMYACRRLVLQSGLTDPGKGKDGFFKNSSSFTQGVLPDYMERHPEETKDWDVVFDDRGHFAEPHTDLRIGIGTLAVRDYLRGWVRDVADDLPSVSLRTDVGTCGPANRYRFALFVEKEGFDGLLASAQTQERYDLALMSTKGMSVTAARQLVERLSREGVTVLVLHDLDKSGLSILHTLRSNTRRYKYKKQPKVIDLGLRWEDVQSMGLEGERVTYKTKADPREGLRRSGATAEECAFLVSGGRPGRWEGRRVELNEMTSPQFLAFLEAKLAAAGVRKVVPDGAALAAAYRLQHKRARLQQVIDEALEDIDGEDVEVPAGLRKMLTKRIDGKPVPWDRALWGIVKETLAAGGPSTLSESHPSGGGR